VNLDREREHATDPSDDAVERGRDTSAFRGAWWLPHPHLQTVWGQMARSRALVAFERELLPTLDGDELVLDHVAGPARGPRLLILHGLEGSSYSVYAQGMAARATAAGARVTVLNFRSCARDPHDVKRWLPNHRPRLYHSGETTDLDHVAQTLAAREPDTALLAVGVSLGGNVLLKWLGEHAGQTHVRAAATISVPYDLDAGARHLTSRTGRIYVRNFLGTLLAKAGDLVRRFPEIADRIDLERAARALSFHDYDDAATAPLHGFADAADYYARSSSLHWLARIATPTLCVSAVDDPFLPRAILDQVAERAPRDVELRVTRRGGHVGFVTGPHPRRAEYWAERTVVDWLLERAGHRAV
jgi:predicted alpha/beta-fold hydrolase